MDLMFVINQLLWELNYSGGYRSCRRFMVMMVVIVSAELVFVWLSCCYYCFKRS